MIVPDVQSVATAASRRCVLRGLGSAASVLALGGCAGLASGGPRFDASAIVQSPSLLLATTRKPVDGGRTKPWYGPERAPSMTVARVKLTPPDDGRFSLASVGLVDWQIENIEGLAHVGDLIPTTAGGRDVLLYVHGYNTTFETAVLDAARLSDAIKFVGDTMVFSWPSRASLLDYGYDRESALWSRDALQQVLDSMVGNLVVGHVHVVAHSIGTMLTMEALRQLYAQHGEETVNRIGSIVFASPDIDMDGFASSVKRIGPLAGKITVVTATTDRALAVSRWIAGGITRVGAAEGAQLTRMGIRVIDASKQGWGIINHDLFLSNAQVRKVIRNAIDGNPGMSANAG